MKREMDVKDDTNVKGEISRKRDTGEEGRRPRAG